MSLRKIEAAMRGCSQRLLLAIAALAMAGCSGPVTGLKTDLGFSTMTFSLDKIAIGGVAVSGEADAGREADSCSLLTSRLIEKRDRSTVIPVDYVRGRIGVDAYEELLAEYRTRGALSKTRIAALREKLQAARYVVFSRIESDKAHEVRVIRAEKGKNGKPLTDRQRVTTQAIRTVVVSLKVYDLEKGRVVWSGSIDRDGKRELEYLKFADGLVTMITPGVAPPDAGLRVAEPGAPKLEAEVLLGEAFSIFAESLPKI